MNSLNASSLNELTMEPKPIMDSEVASSSRETEYSQSIVKQVRFNEAMSGAALSEKAKKNRGIEKRKRNITMNLKEDNDRAALQ